MATLDCAISTDANNTLQLGTDGLYYSAPSTITENNDGTITHTNGAGVATVIDIGDEIIDNGDNTFTVNKANGATFTIEQGDDITDNGDSTYTVVKGDGTVFLIDASGGGDEIVDNGDGTFTVTKADGVTTFDITNGGTLVDNGGTLSYTNPDGTVITFAEGGNMVNNGNGSFTFTEADGTVHTWNTGGVLVDNLDTTFTFTNPDGTTITINDHSEVEVLVDFEDTNANVISGFHGFSNFNVPVDGIYHINTWVDATATNAATNSNQTVYLEANVRTPVGGVTQNQVSLDNNAFPTVGVSWTGELNAGDFTRAAILRGGNLTNGTITTMAIRHSVTLLRRL